MIVDLGEDTGDFTGGFFEYRDAIATSTPRFLMQDLLSSQFDTYEIGRKGCSVFIRNSDLSNTCHLFWGFSPTTLTAHRGWRLYPGESIIMKWTDRLLRNLTTINGTNLQDGLHIATVSGTCRYDWMVSRAHRAFPITIGQNQLAVDV